MEIIYHGHSCIQISDGGHSLIIDPFITGNPLAKTDIKDIRVDYVLLTHAHGDHITDAVPIAKNNDATIIATFELANYMSWQGVKTFALNIGGRTSTGYAEVEMTQAFHSSSIIDHETKQIIYGGMPGGFIVRWNGKTLYHSGDTSLFSDLKLYGERNRIDVAFLPIGDVFTMGPEDAALAAQWLNAGLAVPLHFNTFPPIQQNPKHFEALLQERGIAGRTLEPGEKLVLE